MRIFLIPAIAVLLSAAPALAQQPAPAAEAETVTLILPDGSTETIVLAGDEVIRLIVRDGHVEVERSGVTGERRAFVLGPRAERDGEVVDIEIERVFERLPEIVRERLEEVALPRVRVEMEPPTELRRQISEAERTSRRLALEVRRAEREGDRAEAARLRTELHRVLEDAFELHQAERVARLEALERRRQSIVEEARELEDEIELRRQRRAELIERRAEELTRERDSLDW